MNRQIFREVRYAVYVAVLINGFLQWLIPFEYKCNITGEECFACGLRTAVTLLLQGRFSEAYQSNKLIIVVVIIGIVMSADILHHLYQRQKAKNRKDIHA